MSMSDVISDMLIRIKNAQKSKLVEVFVSHSRMKVAILDNLKKAGYIKGYNLLEANCHKTIVIELKYLKNGSPAIVELKRISKPGKRIYSSVSDLGEYYSGMGVSILSTSSGVILCSLAKKLGVGGEVICKVF